MSNSAVRRCENGILFGIFCAALVFHLYSVTSNWTIPFMAGHEFRQAQTAITSYYIDQQNNFSLLYEVPIFGKPWISILLEVPVYEWSVVLASRFTGLSHLLAARSISLACFYLTLPALYLLLGRFTPSRPRRLLVLALVLTCPVYIFYSRAFLMDSMVLMCCTWFLLGFVRTMTERRWSWLALTIMAGTGAALIKSAMLVVWIMPAAGYGAWLLWRDLRAGTGWRAPVQTLLWGLATIVVALGSLRWWVTYTDPIKAAHPSAWIFTSKNLAQGNWGLFDFAALFSREVWGFLLGCWQLAIMSPWLIGLILVAGLTGLGSVRWRVLGWAVAFFLPQLLFPFAYAYQDYYFYGCAIFLLGAFGFVLHAVLDSRLPAWSCWLLIAVPFVAQVTTYWQGYRPQQQVKSPGSNPWDDVLRELSPRNSVIIVAGADWAAMTPLYAQRKALMIRNGLEFDAAYLHRAFNDLADEDVSAVVVAGPVRTNLKFLRIVSEHFDLDMRGPTFFHPAADVYVRRIYVSGLRQQIKSSLRYYDIKVPDPLPGETPMGALFPISAPVARTAFANVSPAPYQGKFFFGYAVADVEGDVVLSAHPDSDLWLKSPTQASRIKWDYGVLAPAYERKGDKTDGVEFVITGETPDGRRREVYRRLLDPVRQPADRGRQHEVIPYTPVPGETLQFSSKPNANMAYDWTYWVKIVVE